MTTLLFGRPLREALNICSDWRVFEAQDGREGGTKAQELLPDLIVLDMSMPVMLRRAEDYTA
jgi:CheY-like chemotaxis protein